MALEAFWLPLLPAYLIGLLASWALEALLLPRPQAPWRRSAAANLTHVGVWTLAFALEMALFQRPYFAIANVLAIELLLVLVSRAKYEALQEPFVYPDFEYFTDAMKHPRLYLPFFGWGKALVCAGGYGVALWGGLVLEPAISTRSGGFSAATYYLGCGVLATVGLGTAWLAGRRISVNFDTDQDLIREGLVAALWAYARAERAPVDEEIWAHSPFASPPPKSNFPDGLPDLVSIQSESFFDVRRAYPIVRTDVLSGFDEICAEAVAYGELEVAARGANTVRTEFAFLSGIDPERLGVHRYNPYRKLAKQGGPTLATYLKALGYRTVCIHPYHGSFYSRNKVLPKLGFDEFVDLASFSETDKFGAYVGDVALAEKTISFLSGRQPGQPVYVHVITMENHGPLHVEKISESCVAETVLQPVRQDCSELIAYLRHIRNADRMFSLLRTYLLSKERPARLCVYGDHVPIMPNVYKGMGKVSGSSDYAIWARGKRESRPAVRKKVHELASDFMKMVPCG
ncbi:LTA synthase family protein [Bordetella trematum]|uniref:LTA synthase family protein n=1 Tax=Bordetella trematum TaxID=123899 RepID=UPI000D8877F9|nr:LTA synthase family protein [Bordetella trematum]SPU49412.1 capsular polysaccharide biosynthesis protein [Bordetella trematum]VDH08800.1 Lipoteichoic acid synthase 1 [Bordetella trematum]